MGAAAGGCALELALAEDGGLVVPGKEKEGDDGEGDAEDGRQADAQLTWAE
jgi:hypothetical protein